MTSAEELLDDVRPKRQTRLPTRFQDYDVEYENRPRDSSLWRSPPSPPHIEPAAFLPPSSAVNLSRHYSPQPPSGGSPWDAAHSKTPQLARDHLQRRNLARDILPGAPTSPRWGSYRDPSPYPDIRDIQEENARLLQTQQTFLATLKELHEARREMKELIGVARSLREDMEQSTHSSHSSYRPLRASAATSQPNPTLL